MKSERNRTKTVILVVGGIFLICAAALFSGFYFLILKPRSEPYRAIEDSRAAFAKYSSADWLVIRDSCAEMLENEPKYRSGRREDLPKPLRDLRPLYYQVSAGSEVMFTWTGGFIDHADLRLEYVPRGGLWLFDGLTNPNGIVVAPPAAH